jgi:uncharacterized protein YpmS
MNQRKDELLSKGNWFARWETTGSTSCRMYITCLPKCMQHIAKKLNVLPAQELRKNNSGSTDYKFAVNETISKLQGALRETNTKIQLVVAMIGTASQHTDINSSVWESMGQLQFKLGI